MNKQSAQTRREVAQAVVQLIPYIMRGTQLDFFLKRGVTQTQFLLLCSIRAYVRCPMGTLAHSLQVSLPTVSGVVDRLVRAGYLRRQPDADDRRQVLVSLAPKGEAFFKDFETVVRGRWEEALITLEPEELEAFHDVVLKLRVRLQPMDR